MWQGLQSITDYKGKPNSDLTNDTSLPDKLNAFYARFDNIEPGVRAVTDPEDWLNSLSKADVRRVFIIRSTPARPWAPPTVFQGVFSEPAQNFWQAYSQSFSTSPCPRL